MVGGAGFDVQELSNEYMNGPGFVRPWGYLYHGIAVKPSA
jgi:hypothetical protein